MWGTMSLTSSFMTDYWTFLVTRSSTAVGHAVFLSLAPVILADMFSERIRTVVVGVYLVGVPVGCGLGYMVSGNRRRHINIQL